MKKALSVLLVAAALFGFYGSAVTVNDLLACKDYWEEAGEKSTADMNKLEDGLNQLKDNEQAYLDGKDQVEAGEATLADAEEQLAEGGAKLTAGRKKLSAAKTDRKNLKKVINRINAVKKEYKKWEKSFNALKPQVPAMVGNIMTASAAVDELITQINALKDTVPTAYGLLETQVTAYADDDKNPTLLYLQGAFTQLTPMLQSDFALTAARNGSDAVLGAYQIADGIKSKLEDTPAKALNSMAPEGVSAWDFLATAGLGDFKAAVEAGVAVGDSAATCKTYAEAYDDVKVTSKKLDNLKKKASAAAKAILGNKDIMGVLTSDQKAAVRQFKTTKGLENVSKAGAAAVGKADNWDAVEVLYTVLNGTDESLMPSLDKILAGAKDGIKQYNDGINKGAADLAKGEADYANGAAQIADGRKTLEDGKAQLAQYEDGEQQVRDGLATLFNTEADLDLESIANRLNGDGDFDNGDNHLDIDEGLNAVDVGRGYQAEDGVLITNEIMGRAVATGGLLAAAVLAVLAAILSFLKKNKAAGVFAILAAAAGAFGAFYGPAQGTYFSEIAGSTIGTTTWVAAGVLGAVALVHAIAHFAAPKTVA